MNMIEYIIYFSINKVNSPIYLFLYIFPGSKATIKLYSSEIFDLIKSSLESNSWLLRANAAKAVDMVVQTLGIYFRV